MADLDAQVRAADPDRWLASRFVVDVRARADLIALYAFEAELMAIPTRVSQPLLAEMRYVWWREQMDGVFAGAPRKGHPVIEALADVAARCGLERACLDALIDAHVDRAHGRPHHLEALFVGPMQAAARVLAGAGHDEAVAPAARVRGLTQTGRFDEARALRPDANGALKALPVAAFPAVAPAALTRPDAPDAVKRVRLTWAHLRGRI
ncbi:MAG: squalene/phytoene synthase family protein [Alphaproteobacteria bacterium]|nr:squalene/phytoene synthase family protein [Alphaproteobacteria bacterium]MBU1527164.1 squalene/phytoene synthase family protein [Alphaproteobacteria bacterium]MBU2118500.1 squalene/phytoene synthase family protein [Alphaproteobacteria bacterium]MBU2351773.1 squalene/phytoene synthase family protein [Alphaproteobacteria bacterium]MBU2383375.1 squalene/phytoene synthase family protein [Alphaproteobacteria bacterium]